MKKDLTKFDKYILACQNGDLNQVKEFVDENQNIIYECNNEGLRLACSEGFIDITKYICKIGAYSKDYIDNEGWAIINALFNDHTEIAHFLLDLSKKESDKNFLKIILNVCCYSDEYGQLSAINYIYDYLINNHKQEVLEDVFIECHKMNNIALISHMILFLNIKNENKIKIYLEQYDDKEIYALFDKKNLHEKISTNLIHAAQEKNIKTKI